MFITIKCISLVVFQPLIFLLRQKRTPLVNKLLYVAKLDLVLFKLYMRVGFKQVFLSSYTVRNNKTNLPPVRPEERERKKKHTRTYNTPQFGHPPKIIEIPSSSTSTPIVPRSSLNKVFFSHYLSIIITETFSYFSMYML